MGDHLLRLLAGALWRTVARTHMNTYGAKVWDLSIVQGPFSVAPCQTLRRIRNDLRRCRAAALTL
jgi:hypothetical protein